MKHRPFPPDTEAFLYYSIPPGKPRIAGELRLRVASSNDVASFKSGSDLLRPNGHPWTRPLYSIPKIHSHLYEKLREENLVSDDLDRVLSTSLSINPNPAHRSHILYTLNDIFIVNFSITTTTLFVVTEKSVQKMELYRIFSDGRGIPTGIRPYSGIYTNHLLSILLFWLFSWICRECLGSIWTFHTPRAQRHKDSCVTLSQDNHTCEVYHPPLRWLHMSSKGRRALPEIWTQSP